MLIRCFIGTVLIGLCVAYVAAPDGDPFAALSVSIVYVLILAAICGSVVLLLAVIATADRVNQFTRKEPRK